MITSSLVTVVHTVMMLFGASFAQFYSTSYESRPQHYSGHHFTGQPYPGFGFSDQRRPDLYFSVGQYPSQYFPNQQYPNQQYPNQHYPNQQNLGEQPYPTNSASQYDHDGKFNNGYSTSVQQSAVAHEYPGHNLAESAGVSNQDQNNPQHRPSISSGKQKQNKKEYTKFDSETILERNKSIIFNICIFNQICFYLKWP